jgi:hypothetical protein
MLQISGAVCHRSLVIVAGGFSVFAGVGERTREGNDLYKEMIESGVIKTGDKQVRSQRDGGVQLYWLSLFYSLRSFSPL